MYAVNLFLRSGSIYKFNIYINVSIEGNVFKSNTKLGLIQYTTPSVMELHGLPYEDFGPLNEITYQLGLKDFNSDNQALSMI